MLHREKDRKSSKILGIRVDSTTSKEVLILASTMLANKYKFYITTPNPEIILEAHKNIPLRDAINNSEISVPDGIGLKLAGVKSIVKGRELFIRFLKKSNSKRYKVFFLGSTPNVNSRLVSRMGEKFPQATFKGASGPKLNKLGEPDTEKDVAIQKDIYEKINKFKPHLLFIAFGAPKQELWIYKNIKNLDIGGAMVVGGTFDYYAGVKPLPPRLFDTLGLEWLWRLLHEPGHIKRVYRALVRFPYTLVKSKLIQK